MVPGIAQGRERLRDGVGVDMVWVCQLRPPGWLWPLQEVSTHGRIQFQATPRTKPQTGSGSGCLAFVRNEATTRPA